MARPTPAVVESFPRDLQEVVRDIYRFLDVPGPAGPAGDSGARGTAFVDRGDPAAVDWDEGDLTADGAWHDLDLSGVVPPGAALVLLRVRLEATVQSLHFRKNGNSNEVNVTGEETGGGASIMHQDLLVAPDSNAVIEYMLSGAVTSVDIVIGGWWI